MDERLELQNEPPARAYRAVFFDLDGTLLPMELEDFLGSYFKAITQFVDAHELDADSFSAGLKAGIGAMASHDDERTNYDVYWEEFFRRADPHAADWNELLTGFYEHDFGEVGADVVPDPNAARAIRTLTDKGYPLVLATMPMFPLRAVQWRLSWAGVDPRDFSRLTSYENSTSVKPKRAYCAENMAACGLKGSEVLMVGNNTVEDLSFLKLGADAFLVTDHLLDPVGYDLATVKHGSMADFADWVESLPVCENPARDINPGVVDEGARLSVLGLAAADLADDTASAGLEAQPGSGRGVSASTAEVMSDALDAANAAEPSA